ncbi:hypothetical protein C8J56DRAFT_879593 [Mycena floridula]|nr:hypothetical protein C8J56DRAFT_879593 [Mycena floridula]
MWGSSTRNTRIERIWVEVGSQFARMWRAFFHRLEAKHLLNHENPHHLWLIHRLFLEDIRSDCAQFRLEWNAHPISGEGHNQSPNIQDMRFMGQTQLGVYIDEFSGTAPSVLEHYYGTTRGSVRRRPHQTGAGHPADEESSDEEITGDSSDSDSSASRSADLADQIAEDHDSNFLHDAVDTPRRVNPFPEPTVRRIFEDALATITGAGHVPAGFGILPDEWEDGEYPSFEILRSGRRGTKELRISLPDTIWRPRAVQWVQALDIMTQLIERLRAEDPEAVNMDSGSETEDSSSDSE